MFTASCRTPLMSFAWSLGLGHDPAGGPPGSGGITTVTVLVTNEQGAPGVPAMAAAGLVGMGWDGLAWTPPVYPTGSPTEDHSVAAISAIGSAGLVLASAPDDVLPGPLSGWEAYLYMNPDGTARIQLDEFITTTNSIFGCDGPSPTGPALSEHWMTTCGDGSIKFELAFGGEVSLTKHMSSFVSTGGASVTVGVSTGFTS